MESKKLSEWQELKKNLKQLLKKYHNIRDIIVFGSFLKSKPHPKDLDLALIVNKKDTGLSGEVKSDLKTLKLDIEILLPEDLYQTRLGLSLITEGFSIRNEKFLRELLNIIPKKIYIYELKHLNQTQKVLFGRGLKTTLKQVNGVKIGSGSVMIPIEETGQFEDFLQTWDLKYKTKEYLVF
jgi:predicted nucleotidyltransferase